MSIPWHRELRIITSLSAPVLCTWKRDHLESQKITSFGAGWAWIQSQPITTHVHNSYAIWLRPSTVRYVKYRGQCYISQRLSLGPKVRQRPGLSPGCWRASSLHAPGPSSSPSHCVSAPTVLGFRTARLSFNLVKHPEQGPTINLCPVTFASHSTSLRSPAVRPVYPPE